MASANCSRCLTRPSASLPITRRITPIVAWTAPFSTTPATALKGNTGAHSQVIGRHIRKGKVMQATKKKKDVGRTGKPPGPGERKAFRKRIQLSNSNALAVEGLSEISPAVMSQGASSGRLFGLGDKLVDQLRALEAFKPTQCWGLFRRPHMLVRAETVDLMAKMEKAAKEKQTLRAVLTGAKISGKSMLLLQAMAHGLLNNWVVINIPEAQDLVNAHTEYSPVPGSEPLQFFQSVYCLQLLQKILAANGAVLKAHKVTETYSDLVHLPENATLADLAASAKEQEDAWPVFQAFWKELTTIPGRPPVLLTLDGLSHIMNISEYRDPAFKLIHSHDLTLVRLFVDLISGEKPLPNGGAIIAATSRSNAPRSASMDLALAQCEAAAAGNVTPTPDPYRRDYDDRVYNALKDVDVIKVSGISKADARAVMEYWAASGVMRSLVNEVTVTEKWTVGGSGILGEMERASLLSMRL